MFVFELETCKVKKNVEAYAAGLYDVNRVRDKWDGGLTPEEVEIKKIRFCFREIKRNTYYE